MSIELALFVAAWVDALRYYINSASIIYRSSINANAGTIDLYWLFVLFISGHNL